jgi:hypothetical protein
LGTDINVYGTSLGSGILAKGEGLGTRILAKGEGLGTRILANGEGLGSGILANGDRVCALGQTAMVALDSFGIFQHFLYHDIKMYSSCINLNLYL